MLAQLIDELLHLKGSHDGLDETSTTDGSTGHANVVLGEVEDVVPEAGLEVGLHLGEVEVWADTDLDRFLGVVEEVESEIEEGTGSDLTVDEDVLLIQVPSTGANIGWNEINV